MTARIQTKTGVTRSAASLFPLLMTLVLWAAPPGTALAQQEEIAAVGQREFRHACAVCHGLSGTGESVMTTLNLLTGHPTDLTQLSKKHQGQFPLRNLSPQLVDTLVLVRQRRYQPGAGVRS